MKKTREATKEESKKGSEPRATVRLVVTNNLTIARPGGLRNLREAAITTVWLLLRVGGTGRVTPKDCYAKDSRWRRRLHTSRLVR